MILCLSKHSMAQRAEWAEAECLRLSRAGCNMQGGSVWCGGSRAAARLAPEGRERQLEGLPRTMHLCGSRSSKFPGALCSGEVK